ncbi:MAG TPA: hypothetical protein VJ862_08660 [Rhodanobacteraceae bacterium]|nr:hypothetical protein [Rhodanobacteraceae bacterium]
MTTEPSNTQPRPLRWRIFPAVAIIAIGVLFLLNNLGYNLAFLDQGNWWAVLILLAALAPLTRAWEIHRARGRADAEVVHSILCGAAVALVGVMFLLELDWGTWWPLFVILGGLFALAPHRARDRHRYGGGEDDASIKR